VLNVVNVEMTSYARFCAEWDSLDLISVRKIKLTNCGRNIHQFARLTASDVDSYCLNLARLITELFYSRVYWFRPVLRIVLEQSPTSNLFEYTLFLLTAGSLEITKKIWSTEKKNAVKSITSISSEVNISTSQTAVSDQQLFSATAWVESTTGVSENQYSDTNVQLLYSNQPQIIPIESTEWCSTVTSPSCCSDVEHHHNSVIKVCPTSSLPTSLSTCYTSTVNTYQFNKHLSPCYNSYVSLSSASLLNAEKVSESAHGLQVRVKIPINQINNLIAQQNPLNEEQYEIRVQHILQLIKNSI